MTPNRLYITDDGKLCVDDYRSIARAILIALVECERTILDLCVWIHKTYNEFRYVADKIIIEYIAELMKQDLIICTYEEYM